MVLLCAVYSFLAVIHFVYHVIYFDNFGMGDAIMQIVSFVFVLVLLFIVVVILLWYLV